MEDAAASEDSDMLRAAKRRLVQSYRLSQRERLADLASRAQALPGAQRSHGSMEHELNRLVQRAHAQIAHEQELPDILRDIAEEERQKNPAITGTRWWDTHIAEPMRGTPEEQRAHAKRLLQVPWVSRENKARLRRSLGM